MQVTAKKWKHLHATVLKAVFHCLKSFNVVSLLNAITNTVGNYFICLIKEIVILFLDFRYKFYRSFFFLIMTGSLGSFFSKTWNLTSSLIPCNVEEHVGKLLQFTDLYNMTCVYCRVQDKLSVCIKTTPSCIQKKRLELCFCIWTRITWSRISESTFPSKILTHNFWKTAQLSKMLCNSVPLTVQRFKGV